MEIAFISVIIILIIIVYYAKKKTELMCSGCGCISGAGGNMLMQDNDQMYFNPALYPSGLPPPSSIAI